MTAPVSAAVLTMLKDGNQATLNALAAANALGAPRGPDPYAHPTMGDPDVETMFSRAEAIRFFSTVIWGYVQGAIVAGRAGYFTPRVFFAPMISHQGNLWATFNTDPIPLPINDVFYTPGAKAPAVVQTTQLRQGTALAALEGLTLVTIPGSGGIRGYKVTSGRYAGRYVIPGNTNGHPVDVTSWLWWAYTTGRITAGKAWGSSPNLKAWGAPFKSYSSVLDKIAPDLIKTVVILGVSYGIGSALAEGANAGAAGADTGATTSAEANVSSAGFVAPEASSVAAPVGATAAPIGASAADLAPLSLTAGAGGGAAAGSGSLLTKGAADVAVADKALKAGVAVAGATGLIHKNSLAVPANYPPASSAVPSKPLPTVAKVAGLGALGLLLFLVL